MSASALALAPSLGAELPLRDYQFSALADLHDRFCHGERRILIVAPTGSGKTVLAAHMLARALSRGRRCLFLAHRRELLEQAGTTLARLGVSGSVLVAGSQHYRPDARMQVASIQTLVRRVVDWVPDLVVVDEAHRAVAATYCRVLDRWPSAWVLGLTATPWRWDGKGLGDVFGSLCVVARPDDLVARGWIVEPRAWTTFSPNLKGVHRAAGEFVQAELEERVLVGVGDIVRHILHPPDGATSSGRTLVYAVSIRHSRLLVEQLCVAGCCAEHIDGETPIAARAAILTRFAAGTTQIVCNVDVLSEGYDLPSIDTIVLARPTLSSGRYLQMVGRGLRAVPGKRFCRVLDCGGNLTRHWWPTLDVSDHYSLNGAPTTSNIVHLSALWTCPACYAIVRRSLAPPCPECKHVPVPPRKIVADDRHTTLREYSPGPASPVVTWGDRRGTWNQLVFESRRKNYKLMWAKLHFKARFGHFPPASWTS